MKDETVDDDRHYSGRPVTVEEHDALAKAVAALSARVMRLEDTTTICAQDGTPLYMVQNADRTDEVHRAPAVTDAHIAFEDWTRSVWRTPTGVSILATPPDGEVRPMLIVDLPEATARWLGGRILAALDVKAPKTTTKVAEEPEATAKPKEGAYLRNPISRLVHLVEVRATVGCDSRLGETWWVTTNPMVTVGSLVQERGAKDRVMEVVDIGELGGGRSRLVVRPAKD